LKILEITFLTNLNEKKKHDEIFFLIISKKSLQKNV